MILNDRYALFRKVVIKRVVDFRGFLSDLINQLFCGHLR